MRKHRVTPVMSRLPVDEAYWEALTDRLVMDAVHRLSTYDNAGARWWYPIARHSTVLTVGAIAVVIAGLLWLPGVMGGTRSSSPTTPYGFAPRDPVAVLFVTSADAPSIATLFNTLTSERTP